MKFQHDCCNKLKNLSDHLFIENVWKLSDVHFRFTR